MTSPADDAVTVAVDRPTRAALGCFVVSIGFLALLVLASIGSATGVLVIARRNSGAGQRVILAVAAGFFLLVLLALTIAAIRAARTRHALAFDPDGLWWLDGRSATLIPWAEVVAVDVLADDEPKRAAAATPTLHVTVTTAVPVREHPRLQEKSTATAEPGRVRLSFRLPGVSYCETVMTAIRAYAPRLAG